MLRQGKEKKDNDGDVGVHWEYPSFCIVTTLYIPILSGTVLVITALRIRATLLRQEVKIRLRQNMPGTTMNLNHQRSSAKSTVRRSSTLGSSRTLKILKFTSIAYFSLWSPYVVSVLLQSFFGIKAPAAVEFSVVLPKRDTRLHGHDIEECQS